MSPSNIKYQICVSCVMDTSDKFIKFDENGECNHCKNFKNESPNFWFPNEIGKQKLEKLVNDIKASASGKKYDCILGLSGGVDSSYLALKVHALGLKPLVVHVDAGWNSELAVSNIEKILKYCDFDLFTYVVDWEDMRDLQISYLKSGIANQDVPQDHVFFATLYYLAAKEKIKYIISGGNFSTEGIFPESWHGSAIDSTNLLSIHRRYSDRKLKNYKTVSLFNFFIWYPFVRGIRTVRPLDFMPYKKNLALRELQETIGYKQYGRKHGESRFTKFFQNYYLPNKFGYDKRRAHLSSLIVTEQLSREEALRILEEPLYTKEELSSDIDFICKKLRITDVEFHSLMEVENRDYKEFKSWDSKLHFLKLIYRFFKKNIGLKLSAPTT